jgi:hypothetical protein
MSEARDEGIFLSYGAPTSPRDAFEGNSTDAGEEAVHECTEASTEVRLETASESSVQSDDADEITLGRQPFQSDTILKYFPLVNS